MVLRIKQFFLYVSLFGLFTAITLKTNSSIAAPAARLEDWHFYPEAFQLEINLSAGTTPRYFYLAQPPRMVVDLPDTKLGYVPTLQNYSGAIQRIRVSQLNANVTRIVLDLAPGTSLDPNQVQLQPISAQNTTRWVLRPLIAGGTSSQQENYPPPSNYPPNNYPPPSNYPPNNYPPPSNYPPNNYPPPSNYPSNNYPPPSNYPSNNYPPNNYPPPSNYPSNNYPPPSNLPPNNYPPPSNLPPSNYNYPPPSNLPPSSSNNSQIPLVTVPPLNSNNPTQQPGSVLPPGSFPNQPGNFNSAPLSVGAPGFPVQTVPNYPANVPNSGVFEFGQPFPNSNR
ncbi:AMIN domain-containing protein [Plectonema radiosum NIES-515]|uniref:AMIN domain-containing protein n=1 Tax=Plectonema radiosum NIES-515 TaxID=2986073 RepID=A0ABT3B1L8_9CYAN|nr:AMIN domain-containing protein [Plectonema radiosum]MCV3215273.1 AMIN domain-containing protein [Plectonema radiosum NIES-515]